MNATLRVQNGRLAGRSFPLGDRATVGRDPACDVHLPETTLAERHFVLRREGGGYELRDCGSGRGTYVDGRRVDRSVLEDRATIFAGDLVLFLRTGEGAAAAANVVQRAYESSVISLVDGGAPRSPAQDGEAATPLEAIYRIGRLLSSEEDLGAVFVRLVGLVAGVLEADRCLLFLHDREGGGAWKPGAGFDRRGEGAADEDVPRAVMEDVLLSGMATLLHDAREDPRFPGGTAVRSALCVPLLARRRTLGVLWADRSRSSGPFTEEHLKLLAAIGRQAGGGIERRMLERELWAYNQSLEARVANRTEELRRTLDDLAEAQARLVHSERLAAVGLLVQGLAHNMSAPLAALMGTAHLLRERSGGGPEVERILAMAGRLEAIIGTLLKKGRRESASEPSPVDVNELARDTFAFFEGDMFFKHEIDKELRLDESLPRLRVVYSDLSQTLQNLVGNAVDALRDAPPPRVVALSTRRREGCIEVDVTDTGPGVDEAMLPRLFTPFATTKASPDGGGEGPRGTGLGLYAARRLLEPYAGDVTHVPGEGRTTFRVRLPARWAGEEAGG